MLTATELLSAWRQSLTFNDKEFHGAGWDQPMVPDGPDFLGTV
jgi:hypothetical protein